MANPEQPHRDWRFCTFRLSKGRVQIRRAFFCLLFAALSAPAQFINYRGVVNAVSFTPPVLSGGSIAQGSIFSIFGQGVGPPTLAGVSVQVTQGNTSVNAIPIAERELLKRK
jgi:hypothetical protein